MRFCANVSMLWREHPFLERFARARAAGFSTVEMWWPAGEELAAVEAAVKAAGLGVAVLNFDAGDMAAGDRGLLSHPERQHEFLENIGVALRLAAALGCDRLNALVGVRLPHLDREAQLAVARENVARAADLAAEQGALVLIEALNTFENGPYLLDSTRRAADFAGSVGRPNVKLQYDVYHMQRMEGNLVATLREHIEQIAHVQVADSPGRGEPGTGEIHYPFVLAELDRLGYTGYVGLEYRPTTGTTEESLHWLPEAARTGEVGVDGLRL